MIRIEKNINIIVFITKCVCIVLGLLTSITFLNMLIRDVFKVYCLWSFVVILYLFIKHRHNFMKWEYLFLLLFCCSYGLTITIHMSDHFINEIALLGYTGTELFLLTYCDRGRSTEAVKRELKTISWIIVIVTFLFSMVCFCMFFFSFSGRFKAGDELFIYGMYENRLYGLYNPNAGAVLNYISVILSFILLKYFNQKRKFLWVNVAVQTCCFILAQSRGGWVCAITYFVIYMLFIRDWRKKIDTKVKKWLYKGCVTLLMCFLIGFSSNIVKTGLSYVPRNVAKVIGTENKVKQNNLKLKRLDKKRKNLQSATTGRSGMWKLGIQAYCESPILGIGYRSIDDVLYKMMDKKSYLNSKGGNLHNVYITVLVSSGALGVLNLVFFSFIFLKKAIRCFFATGTKGYVKYTMAFIPAWLIGDLVESRIILGMNFSAIIFWLVVGYAMYFVQGGECNGKCNSSSL